MAASHQPYYMHMGPAAIPIMDRTGTLISFPSGHYPGTRALLICLTVLSLSRSDSHGDILTDICIKLSAVPRLHEMLSISMVSYFADALGILEEQHIIPVK